MAKTTAERDPFTEQKNTDMYSLIASIFGEEERGREFSRLESLVASYRLRRPWVDLEHESRIWVTKTIEGSSVSTSEVDQTRLEEWGLEMLSQLIVDPAKKRELDQLMLDLSLLRAEIVEKTPISVSAREVRRQSGATLRGEIEPAVRAYLMRSLQRYSIEELQESFDQVGRRGRDREIENINLMNKARIAALLLAIQSVEGQKILNPQGDRIYDYEEQEEVSTSGLTWEQAQYLSQKRERGGVMVETAGDKMEEIITGMKEEGDPVFDMFRQSETYIKGLDRREYIKIFATAEIENGDLIGISSNGEIWFKTKEGNWKPYVVQRYEITVTNQRGVQRDRRIKYSVANFFDLQSGSLQMMRTGERSLCRRTTEVFPASKHLSSLYGDSARQSLLRRVFEENQDEEYRRTVERLEQLASNPSTSSLFEIFRDDKGRVASREIEILNETTGQVEKVEIIAQSQCKPTGEAAEIWGLDFHSQLVITKSGMVYSIGIKEDKNRKRLYLVNFVSDQENVPPRVEAVGERSGVLYFQTGLNILDFNQSGALNPFQWSVEIRTMGKKSATFDRFSFVLGRGYSLISDGPLIAGQPNPYRDSFIARFMMIDSLEFKGIPEEKISLEERELIGARGSESLIQKARDYLRGYPTSGVIQIALLDQADPFYERRKRVGFDRIKERLIFELRQSHLEPERCLTLVPEGFPISAESGENAAFVMAKGRPGLAGRALDSFRKKYFPEWFSSAQFIYIMAKLDISGRRFLVDFNGNVYEEKLIEGKKVNVFVQNGNFGNIISAARAEGRRRY